MLFHNDVFGIVQPSQFHVALSLPGSRQGLDRGLCVVESRDIREGGCRLFKQSLLELRLTQQHPGVPQEGVVLPAVQPLDVLGGLAATLVPLRTRFDAIELDDLLRLLDSPLIVGLAQIATGLVAYGIQGNEFRAVVLVAVFLLQATLDEGLRTIIISVIAGSKRLPETARRGVFLRAAASQQCCYQ